jgi:hypothetical protein
MTPAITAKTARPFHTDGGAPFHDGGVKFRRVQHSQRRTQPEELPNLIELEQGANSTMSLERTRMTEVKAQTSSIDG